jgi:molybdopterin-containing oxidoreductase family iron-sulfur binding subunit
VEGNPQHPVNAGRLCPRGQASVQGIYNPDRYSRPMARDLNGKLRPIAWEEAVKRASDGLRGARQKVVFMSHLMTGSEADLARRWADAVGGQYVVYEPFAYEALRKANQIVFGDDRIPDYRIDQADFLISFGADFLETWISNVRFTRQFTAFHSPKQDREHLFVYVGPRLSMTGANADYWVSVPPGGERYVALGLLHVLAQQGGTHIQDAGLPAAISAFTPQAVEERTGVKANVITALAQHFSRARQPLALSQGMAFQDADAYETAVAANLLCAVSPGSRQLLDFSRPMSLGEAAPASDIKTLVDRMAAGEVGALIVYGANPVYSLPASWGIEKALEKVPVIISLSSFPDETGQFAALVMPADTFLESWGDYSPQSAVTGLLQPAMGRLFDTRPLGDILLALGRAVSGQARFPEKDFYEVLRGAWAQKAEARPGGPSGEAFWLESLARGGAWQEGKGETSSRGKGTSFAFSAPNRPGDEKKENTFDFFIYPTIQFFDGRLANRPFLQEMPDPVTMITWDGWVEINPETANKLNIQKGDMVAIRAGGKTVEAPAFPYMGIPAGALAMPIGHDHAGAFGRYVADGASGDPRDLLTGQLDRAGGLIGTVAGVTIEKTGRFVAVANTDGNAYQHGRRLARSITLAAYRATLGGAPEITLPLPSGWRKDRDFYPAHEHVGYRWGMVIDLDRCIGCQACVVACYAENNVGLAGKKNILLGRVMSWLHIERYFEQEQPFVRFLPMLCQHCDSAPCESVCPVFAPQHSPEGINNQVYNRCIGTRDCNENCPWKVRRFNWFTWKHDHPLEWQLNPDVTVREKGVMEKCSFCIQRIVQAKTVATSQGRTIRDGEFTTACAQTCPADVIAFGSFMDPESRVSKLLNQARGYQVLGRLNTKTAVIYLKKITREI